MLRFNKDLSIWLSVSTNLSYPRCEQLDRQWSTDNWQEGYEPPPPPGCQGRVIDGHSNPDATILPTVHIRAVREFVLNESCFWMEWNSRVLAWLKHLFRKEKKKQKQILICTYRAVEWTYEQNTELQHFRAYNKPELNSCTWKQKWTFYKINMWPQHTKVFKRTRLITNNRPQQTIKEDLSNSKPWPTANYLRGLI